MANPQMPIMDINQLMEQFKIPGVDVSAIMESRRKDIEALVAANRQAYEGMQKLGQRQAEMLRDAMAEWQVCDDADDERAEPECRCGHASRTWQTGIGAGACEYARACGDGDNVTDAGVEYDQ